MRKLFYFPLEPLQERYTTQLSAPKKGWLERRWISAGVNYERIEGQKLTNEIKHGTVLDANGRGYWALSQIQTFLSLLDAGEVSNDDCLYFDDFWHPGISALPYSFALTGIQPKMYAMVHAQSVDEFDFTYKMRHWMRYFEKGIATVLSGIFVTSTILKDLLLLAGIGTYEKIHITGLPFNSEEVQERFPIQIPEKKKQVVYSSRWDKEKDPVFFLSVIETILQERTDIKFVITTSSKELRSNWDSLLTALKLFLDKYPENIELRVNQTKEQYYSTLLESKVQLNTADQDFVSWTLLEATKCGCLPLYPYFRSFPEVLKNNSTFLYEKRDIENCKTKLYRLIDTKNQINVDWVYKPFDQSWHRMLNVMKGEKYETLYCDNN